MREINDQEVLNLVNSEKLVIIDLFATWCGPCKALAPKLEELNNENKEVVEIVKLDIDQNEQTPMKHNVRGVPTLLFYKQGKLLEQITGNQPKEKLQELINKHSQDSDKVDFSDDF